MPTAIGYFLLCRPRNNQRRLVDPGTPWGGFGYLWRRRRIRHLGDRDAYGTADPARVTAIAAPERFTKDQFSTSCLPPNPVPRARSSVELAIGRLRDNCDEGLRT